MRHYTSISFVNHLIFTECLKLTKALQKTADTLQTVANLYEGHVRQASLFSLFYSFCWLNFVLRERLGEHNWQLMNL